MSFAEQPAVAGSDCHTQRAAVLEPQCQRTPDQRDVGDFVVGGSFDPMQAGDRHARADEHALIPRDGIPHLPQDHAVVNELAGTGRFLDELERRVLHVADFSWWSVVGGGWYVVVCHSRVTWTYRNRRFPREIGVI